jgi:hypothetical protein
MKVHRSLNMVVLRGACVQRNGIQLFVHGYRGAYQQAVGVYREGSSLGQYRQYEGTAIHHGWHACTALACTGLLCKGNV